MTVRLHIHPDHKDWLKPILNPIKEKIVITEIKTVKYLNSVGELTNIPEVDIISNNSQLDPRGFYYDGNFWNTIVIDNKKYVNWDVNSFSFLCPRCSNRFLNEHKHFSGCCISCVGKIKRIGAKSIKDWTNYKLKLSDEPEGSIYFGIEFEYCAPSDKDAYDIANNANKTILNEFGTEIPAFICSDSSLTNGAELNFWPMTLKYYESVKHIIEKFISLMAAEGISYGHNGSCGFKEQAGIHIHVTNNKGDRDFFNYYEKQYRSLFLNWSSRSLDRYEHYCANTYCLFGPRNTSSTWEYRGYSSKEVIRNPSTLLYYIQFVHVMRECVNDVKLFAYPLHVVCEKMGYLDLSGLIHEINDQGSKDSYNFNIKYIEKYLNKEASDKYFTDIIPYISNRCLFKYDNDIYVIGTYSMSLEVLTSWRLRDGVELEISVKDIIPVKFESSTNTFVKIEGVPKLPEIQKLDLSTLPYGDPSVYYEKEEVTTVININSVVCTGSPL